MSKQERPMQKIRNLGAALLALLVFAGQLKAIPELDWLPIDLTLICAVMLLGIITLCSIRGARIPKTIIIPIILWGLFLLPVVNSPFTEHAINKISLLYSVTLVAVIAPFFIFKSESQIRVFLTTFVVIGIFAMGLTVISKDNAANAYSNRITLEGVNTIGTAQMVCAGVIVTFLAIFVENKRLTTKLILSVISSSMLFVALSSGSRGPVLGAVTGLFVVLIVSGPLRRYFVKALFGIITILTIAALWASAFSSDGLNRVFDFISGKSEGSAQARVELWEYTIRLIADNPLGLGWGGFQVGIFSYPHNLFLELMVEAGIFVAGLAIIFVLFSFKRLLVHSTDINRATLFALLIFALINSMVSSDINGNRLVWILLATAWSMRLPESTIKNVKTIS